MKPPEPRTSWERRPTRCWKSPTVVHWPTPAPNALRSYFSESSTWPSPSWSFSVNFHGWPSIRRSCALLLLGGHHSSFTERPCRSGHGPSTLSAHRPGTARSASAHVSARYGSVTIMTAVRLGVSSNDCRQRPPSGLSSGSCSDCFAASSRERR